MNKKVHITLKKIIGLNKRNIYYKLLKPLLVNNYKQFYNEFLNINNIQTKYVYNEYVYNGCSLDNEHPEIIEIIKCIRKDLLLLIINKWISCNHFHKYKNVTIFITDKFLRALSSLYSDIIVVLYSSINDTINDIIFGLVNKFFLMNYYNPSYAKFMHYYNSIIIHCTDSKDNVSIYSNDDLIIDNIKKIYNKDDINKFILEYNYYHDEYGGFKMLFNKDKNNRINYSDKILDSKSNNLYYFISSFI